MFIKQRDQKCYNLPSFKIIVVHLINLNIMFILNLEDDATHEARRFPSIVDVRNASKKRQPRRSRWKLFRFSRIDKKPKNRQDGNRYSE